MRRSSARQRAAGSSAQPDLDLSHELKQLRSASPLLESMGESGLKSAARFVLQSFWFQLALFVVLAVVSVLLPWIAQTLTGLRLEPGAFAYFLFFILATLYFTRFRYKESFVALGVILFVAIGLHALQLFPGFKPTPYFWLTVLVIGTMNAYYYNDYTITIAEQNLELRTLRKEVLASDRLVGRVSTQGGADQMDFVKKAQEETSRTRAHYTSLISNLMQFGGGGGDGARSGDGAAPNYAAICRAAWQLLKRGVGVTRMEVFFFDPNRNLLYTVKAFVSPENSAGGPFGFSTASQEEIPAEKAKMTLSMEKDSLFKFAMQNRRMVLRHEIDLDPKLQELEKRTPCPVHSLIPLIDGETVLGMLNMSECSKKELGDEDMTILRTTTRLASMGLAHAQTFLQTREELETAKVLTGEERKKRADVLKVFKTLVSANIVEEILNDPEVMKPKRQMLTIVFVDLRGFTTLSEQLDAAQVVELLDDFFETLTPLIFKYGGTLDKYIGDEIMALWGAPFAKPDDCPNAILAAVEMMHAMDGVKTRWKQKLNLDIAIGIAVNTGEAIVGSIGSTDNKNFTAIGDAVNTAARLEGLSGRDEILMTRATYDEVRDIVKVKHLPNQKVKGKETELEIYRVLGLNVSGAKPLPEPQPLPEVEAISEAAATSDGPAFELPAEPPQAPVPATAPPAPRRQPENVVDVTIGTSRDLASRASRAMTTDKLAPPSTAGSSKSSRDLASRASRVNPVAKGSADETGNTAACPRCRHVNKKPGLTRCDKCGETLHKS